MENLHVKFCLFFGIYLTFSNGALSAPNFAIVAAIGETISSTLNLTKLGWHTDDIVRSVLAWNNARHPIAKLENGSTHSECYDLSFLGSVRCSDLNITVVETNVVCIKMRVVTKAMAADYIYYPFYSVVNHSTSFVQISVHLKDTPNPTSAASYVTPRSSIHTGANRKTKDPVKNQGLRSVLCTGHFNHTHDRVTDIGGIVYFKLNLTKEGWHTDDVDFSVLAWKNASHPIAKLQNGAEHADCYNDLSFLGSAVRCTDFNVSFIEPSVVGIRMRVITETMAEDYIFYAFYGGAKESIVHLSVHLNDSTSNTATGESQTGLGPTNLPSEAKTDTRAPVKNQASRSDIAFLLKLLLTISFMTVSSLYQS